jgi:stage IV sporulation protein B
MSTRDRRRKVTGIVLVALILTLCSTSQFRTIVNFPNHVRLPVGEVQDLVFGLPVRATIRTNEAGVLALNGERLGTGGRGLSLQSPFSIAAMQTGQFNVDFRLFGLIPFRRITVDAVPSIRLIPGGHSIGVRLRSRGVLVVGLAGIRDREGTLHQPGKEGGVVVGDTILEIGGKQVSSEEHASQLFEQAGKTGGGVSLAIKRKGRVERLHVTPFRDPESGRYRVGLYIRDGAAGVGTLTFYDPASGKYGALGHVIADAETTQAIEVADGHIVDAEVTAIQRGEKGAPGEKIGAFKNEDNWLGTIEKNTRFGIFGAMNTPVINPLFPEPVPITMADQVKEGPAEILTVVEGQKLERFRVEIQRVMKRPTAEGKNMILKITDQRLLAKTGGIVQGMSGSPILQDGRIVGAVTHVFVNDPTRGYGALIEWMLQEAGVMTESQRPGGPTSWFSFGVEQRVALSAVGV